MFHCTIKYKTPLIRRNYFLMKSLNKFFGVSHANKLKRDDNIITLGLTNFQSTITKVYNINGHRRNGWGIVECTVKLSSNKTLKVIKSFVDFFLSPTTKLCFFLEKSFFPPHTSTKIHWKKTS